MDEIGKLGTFLPSIRGREGPTFGTTVFSYEYSGLRIVVLSVRCISGIMISTSSLLNALGKGDVWPQSQYLPASIN